MGRCFDEALLVNRRINRYHAQQAVMLQLAVASAMGSKKAHTALKKSLKELAGD